MGDNAHVPPQTTGLGPSNYVFQEPENVQSPDTLSIANPTSIPQPTPTATSSNIVSVVFPSSEDNLLLRDKIIQKYSSSDNDFVLDVVNHANSVSRKRSKRSSRSTSKKDKCPCNVSDTTSWKPKCCKCNQIWHSACCNLKGIVSITELENWECPWCYVPLYNDPCKPKNVTSVLKSIQLDINSINSKCENLNLSDLQNQISDLKLSISQISSSAQTHENINRVHDDLINSINFELEKIVSAQNAFVIDELSKHRQSIQTETTCQKNHAQNPAVFPGKHYDHHQPDFLQANCKNDLESFLAENDGNFVSVGNREVLYYGEFCYKYGTTEHPPSPMPNTIQQVIDEIHEKFPSSLKINSCLVTKYINGQSDCPSHGDDEPFIHPKSDIFTLSVGAQRSMQFSNCSDHVLSTDESVVLKDNDLLVFSRGSQDFFHHAIPADDNVAEIRYSFTFRTLAPYNINYTAIIGDSNTQDIVFGTDKGKLGQWLPGHRHKASKIANIPDPFTIGPCRNVVLHVGLNDLQEDNPKSSDHLLEQFDLKIKSISSVYPKTKVHISLLLPTKNTCLNYKVNELNKGFKKLASNHRNVNVIEHHNLLDQFGFLNPVLGRYKRGLPNPNDHIHLGPNGIKRFVKSIKSMVLHRKSISVEGNVERIQPSHLHPRDTQQSGTSFWAAMRDSAGSSAPPSGPPLYPTYPPTPFPGPRWSGSPAPRPLNPLGHPASGLGFGNHLDRARYHSQFPPLTSDGYQA